MSESGSVDTSEVGGPVLGNSVPGNKVTDGPGSWACLDWRFLLPQPDLGQVWVARDCPQELAALRALGLRTGPDGEPAQTIIARGATADLTGLRTRLLPDGRLKLTITGRPPRAGAFGLLRPWNAWRRRLRSAGFEVVIESVALPNAARATTMVDLGQPTALRLALLRQPASRTGRRLGRVAELAVRLGLRQLVCRQGVVVAVARPGGAR